MIANPEVQGGCNHGILEFSPVRAEIFRFFSQTALHLDFSSNFRKSWPRPIVGLPETQGTWCSRLLRPIRLKPSRYHSAKRALWYREGGGPWPVRPRARCSFALNRVTDGDIIFGPNPVMALSYDVPRGRSRTRSNVLLTTAHTPVAVEPTRHLAQCRAHTSPTAL